MTMHEISNISYYEYYTKQGQKPQWMKSERYEYCEPFNASLLAKPAHKRMAFFHTFLSVFTQF